MTIEYLQFPLSRFFIRHVGLWKWEAWKFGWKTSTDQVPNFKLGSFRTRRRALEVIEAAEEYEKEAVGVWRFFVDD